jgi:hypothetical protein
MVPVDLSDAILVLQVLTGLTPGDVNSIADINGDGRKWLFIDNLIPLDGKVEDG